MLHEFELGVWKALFIHLIWILHAALLHGELVEELNNQWACHWLWPSMVLLNWYHYLHHIFRRIPTFGSTGTIRRFATNASEMKKLAGWDFEDLLQCVIPVFEWLLPKLHNNHVIKLLFQTAEWHGLAKLWMHTEATLAWLEQVTTDLGTWCRIFVTRHVPNSTQQN